MIQLKVRHRPALIGVIVACFFSGPLISFHVLAQQAQSKCPTTKMTCSDVVKVGEKLTFTANVQGGDKDVTPTYNWAVSAGVISAGQGTSTITVDTKEVAGSSTVTATVEVGGYDRECGYGSTIASCSAVVEK
jgi:hypothetical protein